MPIHGILVGACVTLGAGALATLKAGRWCGIGLVSVGGVGLAAALCIAEVLKREEDRRRRSGEAGRADSATEVLDSIVQRELQQLLEVAIGRPRMLLTPRCQATIQRITRQIAHSNGSIPWQLLFVYRQMEAMVDTLSYDELYDLFGGNPTPPAIPREEVKCLPCKEFDSPEEDSMRSDTVSCPICLQDYMEGEKLMVLPGCSHMFHSKCVGRWLRARGDCPICRRRIKPREEIAAG